MNLSLCEKLIIPESKVTEYLLNENHHDGSAKAGFFIAHGFDIEYPLEFTEMLISHLESNDLLSSKEILFGKKFILEGKVQSPNKSEFLMRSVWMKPANENVLRFVTAHPIEK